MSVLRRSRGAVAVRLTMPATPPLTSRFTTCVVMQSEVRWDKGVVMRGEARVLSCEVRRGEGVVIRSEVRVLSCEAGLGCCYARRGEGVVMRGGARVLSCEA
eukprot:61852-Prorocentrum_minimum.AAC.1